MEHLELSAEEFNLDNLKKQYKKLAKACHPDLNPDDKEAEEKFKRLTAAYKKLLEKLSWPRQKSWFDKKQTFHLKRLSVQSESS